MKNLKMFAIAVMAFAVMAMGVHATDYEAKLGSDSYETLKAAITEANNKKSGEITLLKEVALSEALTINEDTNVTLNLNGFNITMSSNGAVTVNGTLTIKGSAEITSDLDAYMFTVAEDATLKIDGVDAKNVLEISNTKSSAATAKGLFDVKGSLVVGDYVKMTATELPLANVSHGAILDLSGEFTANKGLFTLPSADPEAKTEAAVININGGKITATESLKVDKKVVLNVKGGTLTATAGIELADGVLNISGGTVKSGASAAEVIKVTGEAKTAKLTISNGEVVSGKNDAPALNLENREATYALTGGKVTGGKKADGAIKLSDTFLEEDEDGKITPEAFITGGTYSPAVVGDTKVGQGVRDAEKVVEAIVSGTTSKDEAGNTVVGTTAQEPEQQNPEDPGDTTIPPVPQTNDNILVYAGLGLVSLASVAFTAKKRED